MSYRSKRELLAQVAPRYQQASHVQKSVILDEFVAATGYARKYAIRLLTRPPLPAPAQIRRPVPRCMELPSKARSRRPGQPPTSSVLVASSPSCRPSCQFLNSMVTYTSLLMSVCACWH